MIQNAPRSWGEVLAMLAALGAAIGLAKLLASTEQITWRAVFQAATFSGGLAAAGTIPLFWFPHAEPAAVVGLGAALATVGLKGIQKTIASWRGRK